MCRLWRVRDLSHTAAIPCLPLGTSVALQARNLTAARTVKVGLVWLPKPWPLNLLQTQREWGETFLGHDWRCCSSCKPACPPAICLNIGLSHALHFFDAIHCAGTRTRVYLDPQMVAQR